MNYSFNQHNLSEVCIKIRMGIPVLNIKNQDIQMWCDVADSGYGNMAWIWRDDISLNCKS